MSSKQFNAAPLYVQLRTALTRRIANGDWKPGETMPNEIELAREYGLSAGTVRKALDWMEEARLISRQQGRGTFVTGPSSEELNLRFDKLRTQDGRPIALKRTMLGSNMGAATPAEAELLEIKPGAPVVRVSRLHVSEGNRPLMLEKITLSVELFPSLEGGLDDYDLAKLALSSGVLIGNGEERLSIVTADAEVSGRLKVPAGAQILSLQRLIKTIDERPAEWRQAWCNIDGYRYEVDLP